MYLLWFSMTILLQQSPFGFIISVVNACSASSKLTASALTRRALALHLLRSTSYRCLHCIKRGWMVVSY
jgi:hypothetical protein